MDGNVSYPFRKTRRGVTDEAGVSLRGGTIAGALAAVGVLIAAVALFA